VSKRCEADEQRGAIRRGVGGAKDRDRGECAPTKHAPDSEPGKRGTGRWLVYGIELPSIPEVGMRESHLYGVRGARGNSRPYREKLFCCTCSQPLLALNSGRLGSALYPVSEVLRTWHYDNLFVLGDSRCVQ
jgi:hypothetical protein